MDNTLWNSLHPLNSIDTIVHLGAGKCSWLDTYLKNSAKNIVLVEPEPMAAKYLRTRAKEDERIQVLEKAVALHGERATLNVYNLRQASSLREPSGLKNLYPGIRKVSEIDVGVVKLEDVLQDVIDKIWLVVDVPGEELTIVKSLEQQGLLQKCSLLSISCGEIQLYESGVTIEELGGYIQNQGFDRLLLDDQEDPDRPVLFFCNDVCKKKLENLTQLFNDLESEKKILINDLEGQIKQKDKSAENLKENLMKMSTSLDQKKNCISLLEKNVKDYKAQIENYKQQEKNMLTKFQSLSEENNHFQYLIKEIEGELRNAELEKETFSKQLFDIANELKIRETNYKTLENRYVLRERELIKAENQLQLLKELLSMNGDK